MYSLLQKYDEQLQVVMQRWGIPALRIALGIIYVWFGALKIANVSPVVGLIHDTYGFFPGWFMYVLAGGEVLIGLGFLFNIAPRLVVVLMWLQLGGTFGCFVLKPAMFFVNGNPLLLTVWGEFIMKNIVFLAAGLAIGGARKS